MKHHSPKLQGADPCPLGTDAPRATRPKQRCIFQDFSIFALLSSLCSFTPIRACLHPTLGGSNRLESALLARSPAPFLHPQYFLQTAASSPRAADSPETAAECRETSGGCTVPRFLHIHCSGRLPCYSNRSSCCGVMLRSPRCCALGMRMEGGRSDLGTLEQQGIAAGGRFSCHWSLLDRKIKISTSFAVLQWPGSMEMVPVGAQSRSSWGCRRIFLQK